MADRKKAAASKKKTAPKKNNASKGRAKTSGGKKAQPQVSYYESHRKLLMLIYLVLSLVFLCIAFIPGYNVWAKIRGVFFAFFGTGFYVFNLCMFIIGVRMATDSLKRSLTLTSLAGAFLTVVFSSIIHLATFSVDGGSYVDQLKEAMSDGYSIAYEGFSMTGGILGAAFGGGLLHTCGKAAGFVIVFALLILAVILYLNISVDAVSDSVSSAINKSKEKIDATHERGREKRSIRRQQRELDRQEKIDAQRYELEEERLRREQEKRHAMFDFTKTDVELQDDRPAREYRTPKPYTPQNRLFTFVEPGEATPKDTADEPETAETPIIPAMPEVPAEPELPDGFEEIPDGDTLDDGAQRLVDDAIKQADRNAKKNQKEVLAFPEEKKRRSKKDYVLPPIRCLKEPDFSKVGDISAEIRQTSQKLVDTLKSFGVETTLIGVSRGPSVTRYELQPAPGVKISKITSLADDIALNLASSGVRIEAPIPNKSAVGIEVPNQNRASVTLREIIASSEFQSSKSKLNVALGKDITGQVNCTDLAKMPHLLIAGTTGSGKSVCLNCMVCSILYNASPDDVKLLMIDPKQVEFSVYNGIPHLLVPVISDVRKAAGSLAWAVGEMENRYKLFSQCGVRDIKGFNKYIIGKPEYEHMPQIVIFIDELNDLMMISPKEVEDSICRLAQKARAAGMHLVVATQRPSVDVITGIIKANIPSRLSLSVSSQVDSRTILDAIGAEKLLGNGDMLFSPIGNSKPVRIQGAYVSEEEIENIVDFIKAQAEVEYDDEITEAINQLATAEKKKTSLAAAGDEADDGGDVMLDAAIEVVVETQQASTTLLQRKLRLGYARAARIMDELEQRGVVGPSEGSKPRKVLMSKAQLAEKQASKDYSETDAQSFDILSD